MPTVRENLSRVRAYLRRPLRASLDDGDLAYFLCDRNQYYVRSLKKTNFPWLIKKLHFRVLATADVYDINASDFSGGPFLVETDPDHYGPDYPRRVLTTEPFQDAHLQAGSSEIITPDDSADADSVRTLSFYRDGDLDLWQMKTFPQQSAGWYRMFYEPGFIGDLALAATPQMLPEYHSLLCISTAIVALPSCEWKGLTYDQNERRRAELMPTLTELEGLERSQFDDYRLTPTQGIPTRRQFFGADRRGDNL